uniref:CCHC-type domain-containing protein n=1 Tax=Fundulus heteroclitus TaxID=8078 RepID=A0A3Q2R0P7_FUNHE
PWKKRRQEINAIRKLKIGETISEDSNVISNYTLAFYEKLYSQDNNLKDPNDIFSLINPPNYVDEEYNHIFMTSAPVLETSSPSPEKYSGEVGDCGGFLFQCSLVFNRSPRTFAHDHSKIYFVLRLLTQFGWTFSEFITEFKTVFAAESDERGRRVADFAIEFRTVAAAAGWEQRALQSVLFHSLDESLKDELARVEQPSTLNEYTALVVRLDNCLQARGKSRPERPPDFRLAPIERTSARSAVAPPSPPEPMQLGRVRLTPNERQQRMSSRLCIYCASPAHFIKDCPNRPKRSGPSVVEVEPADQHKSSPSSLPRLCLPAVVVSGRDTFKLSALVDSGCDFNLIDRSFVLQAKIETVPLSSPLQVCALGRGVLPQITHRTTSLEPVVLGNHRGRVTFLVFPVKQAPVVLGFPWLQHHNPQINWADRRVETWSPSCHSQIPTLPSAQVYPEALKLVPKHYHDLGQVFSKEQASSLPPHRPYDCAIDLLPGAPLPTSRLYNISQSERQAPEKYVKESLAAGLIRASSSPLGAGFFFVGKKDGSLRPCIDSIHPFSKPLNPSWGRGGCWCLSPAFTGREAGYTLDRSPVCRRLA